MDDTPRPPARMMDLAWMAFLATKPRPKLIGAVCQNCNLVDHGPGADPAPCTRPVWMDMLCSKCWHMRMAFNGRWSLLQANPAASLLSGQKIRDMADIFGTSATRTFLPEDWS